MLGARLRELGDKVRSIEYEDEGWDLTDRLSLTRISIRSGSTSRRRHPAE
jgi:hypothetical protein